MACRVYRYYYKGSCRAGNCQNVWSIYKYIVSSLARLTAFTCSRLSCVHAWFYCFTYVRTCRVACMHHCELTTLGALFGCLSPHSPLELGFFRFLSHLSNAYYFTEAIGPAFWQVITPRHEVLLTAFLSIIALVSKSYRLLLAQKGGTLASRPIIVIPREDSSHQAPCINLSEIYDPV